MKTYKELLEYEKATKKFITQLKRKSELEISYYEFYNANKKFDYSFIGYETINRGLHGIHYNRTTNTYYFGTRNIKVKSELSHMMYPAIQKIPAFLRDEMLFVANNKPEKPKKVNVKKRA